MFRPKITSTKFSGMQNLLYKHCYLMIIQKGYYFRWQIRIYANICQCSPLHANSCEIYVIKGIIMYASII